jgi:hypothetical protein
MTSGIRFAGSISFPPPHWKPAAILSIDVASSPPWISLSRSILKNEAGHGDALDRELGDDVDVVVPGIGFAHGPTGDHVKPDRKSDHSTS